MRADSLIAENALDRRRGRTGRPLGTFARLASSPPPPAAVRRGPLHRLRGFLAAPLMQAAAEHRAALDALAGRLAALEARADRLQVGLDAVAPRLDRLQDRTDAAAPRFDGLERRMDGALDRLDDLKGAAEVLQARLDGMPARLDGLERGLDALPSRLDRLQDRGDGLAEDLARTSGALSGALDAADARRAEHATAQAYVARQAAEQGRRVAAMLEAFGPRFDEIEIKTRPLIPYDDASWAIRMREGYVMVPRTDPAFALAVADSTTGGLEPGVRRVLRALIEPGMTVADVGANVGLLTLVSAFATGAGGRVFAFEPEARLRDQLEKTLHVNGLAWVGLSPAAVAARAGTARFNVSPIIGHSSLHALPAGEAPREVEVEVTTLDAALPAGQPLDVVKIDVEGAELDVLAGMTRLLAENADIAIVAEFGPSHLERLGLDRAGWFAAFAAHGFAPLRIEEPFGACTPLDDLAVLDGAHSVNIVFVRPGGAAALRLPRA